MYIYEMHQHTAVCSKCGSVTPEDMVAAIKQSGFSGVVLTNHFYHGNSGVDRKLAWQEFCKAYSDEYFAAKKAGEKIGIDVLYGLEESVAPGKEVLIYGIEPDLIGKYPELKNGGLPLLSEIVRNAGGVVIQAHPFRDREWIPNPELLLEERYLDGYEVYNRNNQYFENARALAIAEKTGLLKTAGSDSHSSESDIRYGISSDKRIRTEKELANILKNNDFQLFLGK